MCEILPYVPLVHQRKYTPQNYYKDILHQYNKSNPNKTWRDACNYLQNTIDKYINMIKSTMNVPWQQTTFANICAAIKKQKNTIMNRKVLNNKIPPIL